MSSSSGLYSVEKIKADDKLKHFLAEREVPIVRLEVGDAWRGLTLPEKTYAHQIASASWAGANIILEQTSAESVSLFNMFQLAFKSYLKGTQLGSAERKAVWEAKKKDDSFQRVVDYASAVYANLGNYRSFGDTKILPEVNSSEFERVIKESGSEEALSIYHRIRDAIYDTTQLDIAFGNTTYYTPNVSAEDAKFIDEFLTEKKIEAWNTRLFKNGDVFEIRIASANEKDVQTHEFKGRQVKIVYGDFAKSLKNVANELERAVPHAANETEKQMLEAYVKHFRGGEIDDHKLSQRFWIKDINPVVESNIGFIENYRDPHRVRSEFEGFVAVVNKEMSARFQTLVNRATFFINELPWNKNDANSNGKNKTPFEKDQFSKPDFTSLEVVAFATTGVPAGINIPNYDDIRQEYGFKNVSLGNVLRSQPSNERVTFIIDEDQDIYQQYRGPAFEVQVAGHELLGHGSGKLLSVDEAGVFNFDTENTVDPITKAKVTSYYKSGESWSSKFAGFSNTYEECRAECVGIYLSTYEEMQKIFGNEGQTAEDSMYVNWLNMARAGLVALEFYSPETQKHGQAHMQARYVILRVLLEASKDNGFVKLERDSKGDLNVVVDRKQIKTVGLKAIYDFLLKLGVYKATGDAEKGKQLYDRYSAVDEEFLGYRKEVMDKKKPRRQFVQVVTRIENGDVSLIEFEPTAEGLIESFLERF